MLNVCERGAAGPSDRGVRRGLVSVCQWPFGHQVAVRLADVDQDRAVHRRCSHAVRTKTNRSRSLHLEYPTAVCCDCGLSSQYGRLSPELPVRARGGSALLTRRGVHTQELRTRFVTCTQPHSRLAAAAASGTATSSSLCAADALECSLTAALGGPSVHPLLLRAYTRPTLGTESAAPRKARAECIASRKRPSAKNSHRPI